MQLHDKCTGRGRGLNLPTSGRTFTHITGCETEFPALHAAHDLWINSLQIPPDHLSLAVDGEVLDGVNPEAGAQEAADLEAEAQNATDPEPEAQAGGAPLGVHLLLKVGESASVEDAQCRLTIELSPGRAKKFELQAGARVRIPVSVRRPTCMTVTCQQGSETLPVENFLIDLRNKKVDDLQTKTNTPADRIILKAKPQSRTTDYMVYSQVKTADGMLAFKFPCFRYERDAEVPVADYDVRRLQEDVARLQENPVVMPHETVVLVSMKDAQNHLDGLEKSWQQLELALKDCQQCTAVAELGASADEAPDLASRVDWRRSYCVPKDSAISEVVNLTRSIYHKLGAVSNMAIAPSESGPVGAATEGRADDVLLEVDKTVRELVQTRAKLATALQTRRHDLSSVVPVRVHFLTLEAIDDALRSAYRVERAPKLAESSFAADSIACYDYWLGQMKSNTHNSISMPDDTYDAARVVLANCRRVKGSGASLAPACSVRLSRLGSKVWENMLLQGITLTHPLMAATAPNMLYKKRTVIDYTRHPMVRALEGQHCTATQIQSAKLLAMLVSRDVEHRIITPALQESIIHNFALAASTAAAAPEDVKRMEAEQCLLNLFDAHMQSLVLNALGKSQRPDVTFLTDAAQMQPTTGYDMARVTAFCLDRVLQLQ